LDVAGIEKAHHIFSMSSSNMIDIVKKYGIETESSAELLNNELARYDVKNNKILISNSLQFDTPRWRFTLAHELGHIVLHKALFESYEIEELYDDETTLNSNGGVNSIMDKELEWMEIQANKFASMFLMPQRPLAYQFIQSMQKNGMQRNYLFLDNQECNIINCMRVFADLSAVFGVSKEAVKYRLIKMNFCKEGGTSGKIGDIMRRL
jgi:Zn-dependent peptidase ImmA (M78 family)